MTNLQTTITDYLDQLLYCPVVVACAVRNNTAPTLLAITIARNWVWRLRVERAITAEQFDAASAYLGCYSGIVKEAVPLTADERRQMTPEPALA